MRLLFEYRAVTDGESKKEQARHAETAHVHPQSAGNSAGAKFAYNLAKVAVPRPQKIKNDDPGGHPGHGCNASQRKLAAAGHELYQLVRYTNYIKLPCGCSTRDPSRRANISPTSWQCWQHNFPAYCGPGI